MSAALRQFASMHDEEMVVFHGYDAAVLGIVERCGSPPVLVYDADRIITILMQQGMSEEEAEEFFSFNVLCCYAGTSTPYFLTARYFSAPEI